MTGKKELFILYGDWNKKEGKVEIHILLAEEYDIVTDTLTSGEVSLLRFLWAEDCHKWFNNWKGDGKEPSPIVIHDYVSKLIITVLHYDW